MQPNWDTCGHNVSKKILKLNEQGCVIFRAVAENTKSAALTRIVTVMSLTSDLIFLSDSAHANQPQLKLKRTK